MTLRRPDEPERLPLVVELLGEATSDLDLALAARVAAAGYEVVLAGPSAPAVSAISEGLARFQPVDVPPSSEAISAPGQLASAVRDARLAMAGASVVHAHGYAAGLVAVAAIGRRVPLIVTWPAVGPFGAAPSGGGTGAKGAVWRAIQRVIARRATVILAESYDLVDTARRLGARDARLALPTAPPVAPIDIAAVRSTRSSVRAELGLVDRPLLLTVSSSPAAYALVARLAAWDREPMVVVLGEFEAEQLDRVGVEALSEEARARVYVLDPVLGHEAEVVGRDLLTASDVVVLAGADETEIAVAQAALRAGRPLVATDTGGLSDLVGEAALLTDDLRDGVERVLDEAVLAKRLSVAGPAQAATWPDEAAVLARQLAIYEEVLRTSR